MTHSYSTKSIGQQLAALGLPFPDIFARAMVALLTARKISLHHITHLMPDEQNSEAGYPRRTGGQQLRRCLDHETLTQERWALAIAALYRVPNGFLP
jgi:hypothetical protein